MDIESIERCWREEALVLPPRLEEGTVRQMIETRASDLRRAVRGRLRREAGYYLPIMPCRVQRTQEYPRSVPERGAASRSSAGQTKRLITCRRRL